MLSKKLFRRLCLTGFLAATAAMVGCAGDDGKVGAIGLDGKDGVDGKDIEIGENVIAGVSACLTCHAATMGEEYMESTHVIHSTHVSRSSEASCLECHDPLDEGWRLEKYVDSSNIPSGGLAAVTCEACHGPSSNHVDMPFKHKPEFVKPDTAVCGTCHTTLLASHIPHHPFADEIAERFATSRHANQNARLALCSACHSHEGFVEFPSVSRRGDKATLTESYAATDAYSLEAVSKKQCATCHDSHATGLRGDGDILDADGDVKFSAEYNLCTACHVVDVTATLEGHGDAGNLYKYELSDRYTSANLWDAEAGTFDYTKTVFYHDGNSSNTRVFVDTHFSGTIAQRLVKFDDSGLGDDIVLKGYNINAGSTNACTICHDPHTAGKMLSVAVDQADNIENAAISYAQGLGDFHTNYLGAALGHGCLPCHSGDAFVPVTLGAALPSGSATSPIGCRTCHDLALANDAPGVNNAAAFAAVREMPAGYEFKFNSGAVVTEDLGNNRICFECHKGRTPAKTQEAYDAWVDAPAGTRNNDMAYLHYAPSMAILFGNDSGMAGTYAGKTYVGRFVHGGGAINGVTKFGCVDCHNVHDTNGNHAVTSKMTTSTDCKGCHEAGAFADATALQARTEAFSVRLLEAIYDKMAEAYALETTDNARYLQFNSGLRDQLAVMFVDLAGDRTAQDESLMGYIGARNKYFPSKAVAFAAAAVWKVFTYEDGAPHGQTHGHGGSWAHNSKFARQVMFDAIQDLGGDTTGLTRP